MTYTSSKNLLQNKRTLSSAVGLLVMHLAPKWILVLGCGFAAVADAAYGAWRALTDLSQPFLVDRNAFAWRALTDLSQPFLGDRNAFLVVIFVGVWMFFCTCGGRGAGASTKPILC